MSVPTAIFTEPRPGSEREAGEVVATFSHTAEFKGAEFIDADLRGAGFVEVDLSGVVMRGVEVRGDIDAP